MARRASRGGEACFSKGLEIGPVGSWEARGGPAARGGGVVDCGCVSVVAGFGGVARMGASPFAATRRPTPSGYGNGNCNGFR